jgi:hypothetical protein
MLHRRRLLLATSFVAVALCLLSGTAQAEATAPRLRDAGTYGVIADLSVTSTGATSVAGDLAVAGSSTISGFPPGTVSGSIHLADQDALDAAGDTATVNESIASQPCNSDRTGEDQGGLRLGALVYCYIESATLTGELRLDALGDPDAVWIIQIDGSYEVADGAEILLVNGAQSCNVFWQVDGTVIVGSGAKVAGTFVAGESIVVRSGGVVDGRLFAPQGAVQLADATITQSSCAAEGSTTTTTVGTGPGTTTPVATTTPGTGNGTGDGTGSGNGNGTGGDDGLAFTGPVSMVVVAMAAGALGIGHALLGTERAFAWNKRRWRPRHAESRAERLRRQLF